jgi:cytochrome c
MRREIALAVALFMGASAALTVFALGEQSAPEQTGDAARGKLAFEHRCTGCHALDADREGPRLRDVYGRKAGSVAGFEYSEKLKSSAITWNVETLDRWLADPDAMVPGNNMSFATPKEMDRKDLIAFLRETAAGK